MPDIENTYKTGITNYYGEVELILRDGAYYLSLENWDGSDERKVSEEFALAFIKEFAKND